MLTQVECSSQTLSEVGMSRRANTAGTYGTLTQCQSLRQEVAEMQGFWEMGTLAEGPVMVPDFTATGKDVKIEMRKLVSV